MESCEVEFLRVMNSAGGPASIQVKWSRDQMSLGNKQYSITTTLLFVDSVNEFCRLRKISCIGDVTQKTE